MTKNVIKILLDFLVLIILYIKVFYPKWHKKGKYDLFINTSMYIYLSFVLYFTLMPIIAKIPYIFNHPYELMNMTPFIDVTFGRGDFMRQIGLNVLMTIPFGIMLPLIDKKYSKLSKVILYTFLLSLTIEILQPLISGSRSSDITDIITNLIGGIIGYIIFKLFEPLIKKILKLLIKDERMI